MAPKLIYSLKIETEDGSPLMHFEKIPLQALNWDSQGGVVFDDGKGNLCILDAISFEPKVTIIGRT